MLKRNPNWYAGIAGAALLLALLTGSQPVYSQAPAPVLIYYYVWWYTGVMGEGKTPDWPDPLYNSSDPAVLERQVAQMAGAGVDGMVVGWFGPDESITEGRFSTVLDLASAYGTSALLSVDLGTAAWFGDTQAVVDGLQYAINNHANHRAYFRYEGKPVFVFWFQGRYNLDDWAAIRQQVDPSHQTIWIAEGAVPDAIGVFDGLHMYTISWADNVAGTLANWGNVTHQRGGVWMATSMPGWDNTYTQQSERYIRDRQDGAFFRETFAGAAASSPDLILITSWNEWAEGSYVEPSVKYGDFYLSLMAQLIGEYRSSGSVAGGGGSSPPVVPASTQPPSPTEVASQPSLTPATVPPSVGAEVTPTLSFPPTVTPANTSLPALEPSIEAIDRPTEVAQVNPPEPQSPPDNGSEIENAPEVARGIHLEKLLLGFGIVASGLGVVLIAVFGALSARQRG